jgi:hypothetical protein
VRFAVKFESSSEGQKYFWYRRMSVSTLLPCAEGRQIAEVRAEVVDMSDDTIIHSEVSWEYMFMLLYT